MIYSHDCWFLSCSFVKCSSLSFYRREREREKRESEKKNGGGVRGARGKQGPFQSLKENASHKIRRKRREFWFLIPRGALVLFILQNFIRVYHDRE